MFFPGFIAGMILAAFPLYQFLGLCHLLLGSRLALAFVFPRTKKEGLELARNDGEE